jgi:hypothetical protein
MNGSGEFDEVVEIILSLLISIKKSHHKFCDSSSLYFRGIK